MKICAILITYFPSVSDTICNIKQYLSFVDCLIIWENTPINQRDKYKVVISEFADKIVYMSTEKNEGISYPINKCVEWAKQQNFSHVLTMDQDSFWENFEEFKGVIKMTEKQGLKSVFTPNINKYYSQGQKTIETGSFITSGTLFPMYVLSEIGKLNEALFVDGVDLDYSLRVIKRGTRINVITFAHLHQKFGYPIKSKIFGFTTSNYSAERTHNIVKNHILIYRNYNKLLTNEQRKMIINGYILSRIFKILILENDKYKKIKATFVGAYKGLTEPLSNYFS